MKTLKDTDETIGDLVIIGNWAKSCKTIVQLLTVNNFLINYSANHSFPKYRSDEVLFNQGVVSGIILTLIKTRFGKSK
tara:strand:+ start:1508 stop:1741 length:234 start_codon:yes stop_codon:yes gene_type:complete